MTDPVSVELALYRVGDTCFVEVSHRDPASHARTAPVRAPTALDIVALAERLWEPDAYGVELARQIFGEPAAIAAWTAAETLAQDRGIRLAIVLDPSTQDLHALRWELLRHPTEHYALATSERVVFSRFQVSRSYRPIRLRARSELRAVVAVAAPTGPTFTRLGLAAIDAPGERSRATDAMSGIRVEVVEKPTLGALIDALRDGADILYLVAHGWVHRGDGPRIVLVDDAGDAAPVKVAELGGRVAELVAPPRLVVLASCESAGDDSQDGSGARMSAATTLGEAGVGAVLAMQGRVSMETANAMMPVFFRELLRDGRIDRACAVARGAVRSRPDAWMPVLSTRLAEGRIWYEAGFRDAGAAAVWQTLIPSAKRGYIVPVLGPGLLDAIGGDSVRVAHALAAANGFPLAPHEWDDLPRVTQFLSSRQKRFNVEVQYQEELERQVGSAWPEAAKGGDVLLSGAARLAARSRPNVHALLANLPAKVYVTTAYDDLLERSLTDAGRAPTVLESRWRAAADQDPAHPAIADPSPPDASIADPTQAKPLVYHAFGSMSVPFSLVLTEDDYFDFLIGTTAGKFQPSVVGKALVSNSLLFLGFRLTDWRFRAFFRLLRNLEGHQAMKRWSHVAVQVDPELQGVTDLDGTREYLRRYFHHEAEIEIYFGSAEDFLLALTAELAR